MTSVHIRVSNEESVFLKKGILSSEINALKIIKIIKKYQLLKSKEEKLKLILNKNMNDVLANIRKMEKGFPSVKSTKLNLKEEKEIKINSQEMKKGKIKISKEQKESNEIEMQLKEIQKKLQELS